MTWSKGKAAGLDGISSEHLKFFITILTKLFNIFISIGHIPSNLGASNTALGPAVQCQYRNAMVALVHCLLTILGISLLAPSYQNYLKWLFSIDSPHIFLAQTINVD